MKAITLVVSVIVIFIVGITVSVLGISTLTSTKESLGSLLDLADLFKGAFEGVDCLSLCYVTPTYDERLGMTELSEFESSYRLPEYFPCNQKFLVFSTIILETATLLKKTLLSQPHAASFAESSGKCMYNPPITTTDYKIKVVTPYTPAQLAEVKYCSDYYVNGMDSQIDICENMRYRIFRDILYGYDIDYPSVEPYTATQNNLVFNMDVETTIYTTTTIDYITDGVQTSNFDLGDYNYTYCRDRTFCNKEYVVNNTVLADPCNETTQFGTNGTLTIIQFEFTGIGYNESVCNGGWNKVIPFEGTTYCLRSECINNIIEKKLALSCINQTDVTAFDGYSLRCDSLYLTKKGAMFAPDITNNGEDITVFNYSPYLMSSNSSLITLDEAWSELSNYVIPCTCVDKTTVTLFGDAPMTSAEKDQKLTEVLTYLPQNVVINSCGTPCMELNGGTGWGCNMELCLSKDIHVIFDNNIYFSPDYVNEGCNIADDGKSPDDFEGLGTLEEGRCYAVKNPTFKDYCKEFTRLSLYGYFPCGQDEPAIDSIKTLLDSTNFKYLERGDFDIRNGFICESKSVSGTKDNPITTSFSPMYIKNESDTFDFVPKTLFTTDDSLNFTYYFLPDIPEDSCDSNIINYELKLLGNSEEEQNLIATFSNGTAFNDFTIEPEQDTLFVGKYDLVEEEGEYTIQIKIAEDGTEYKPIINTPSGPVAKPIYGDISYTQEFAIDEKTVIKGVALYVSDVMPDIETQLSIPLTVKLLNQELELLATKEVPRELIKEYVSWIDIIFDKVDWVYVDKEDIYYIEVSCASCDDAGPNTKYYLYRSNKDVSYIDGKKLKIMNCGTGCTDIIANCCTNYEICHDDIDNDCNEVTGDDDEAVCKTADLVYIHTCEEDISFKVYSPAKIYTINNMNLSFTYYCDIIEKASKQSISGAPYDICNDERQKYNTTSDCRPAWTTLIEQEGRCEDFSLAQYSLMRGISTDASELEIDVGYCDMPCSCKDVFNICDIDYSLKDCMPYSVTRYNDSTISGGCASNNFPESSFGYSYDVSLSGETIVLQDYRTIDFSFYEVRTKPNVIDQKCYKDTYGVKYCNSDSPCNELFCDKTKEYSINPCPTGYTLDSNSDGTLTTEDKCVKGEVTTDLFCDVGEKFCTTSPFYSSYCISDTKDCATAVEDDKIYLFDDCAPYMIESFSDAGEGYYKCKCETSPDSVSRLLTKCASEYSISAEYKAKIEQKCQEKFDTCESLCDSYGTFPLSQCSEINQKECLIMETCDTNNDGVWLSSELGYESSDSTVGTSDDVTFVQSYCSYCNNYPCELEDNSGNNCELICK